MLHTATVNSPAAKPGETRFSSLQPSIANQRRLQALDELFVQSLASCGPAFTGSSRIKRFEQIEDLRIVLSPPLPGSISYSVPQSTCQVPN
jgi:hypothetical protein